jgi:DNA-binding XRE family transcriptional regulator
LFSKEVPLGWARKLIQRAAAILKRQSVERIETAESLPEAEISGNLTDLFDNALDDIWKG